MAAVTERPRSDKPQLGTPPARRPVVLATHPTTPMLAREYAALPQEEDLEAVRGTAGRAAVLVWTAPDGH